jgi:tetratricopeptide (TPR) repeat protein
LPGLRELVAVLDSLYVADVTYEPARGLLDTVLALNVFERAGYEHGVASSSGTLASACDFIPAPRVADHYHRRALSLAERGGNPDLAATLQLQTAMHEHFVGEWDSAFDRYDTVSSATLALGDIRGWAIAAGMTCDLLLERGDLEEALALAQESVRRGVESGDRMALAWGEMYAGDALYRMGALAEAEARLRTAWQILLDATELLNAARTAGPLGHCLLRQGRAEEGLAVLQEEQQRMAAHGHKGHFTRKVTTGIATAKLSIAERTEDGIRHAALEEAEKAWRVLLKNGKADKGGLPPAYRIKGTAEWLNGRPRKAEKCWQKSLAVAAELGARYEEALTRLEIGRRLGHTAELERAEAMFGEMGAAFDLAEARRLLEQDGRGTSWAVGATPAPEPALVSEERL